MNFSHLDFVEYNMGNISFGFYNYFTLEEIFLRLGCNFYNFNCLMKVGAKFEV